MQSTARHSISQLVITLFYDVKVFKCQTIVKALQYLITVTVSNEKVGTNSSYVLKKRP